MTTVETKAPSEVKKFPLTTLIAMVVGSMVGAGIFSLPRNFALATGAFGALIAWVIAGTGMLMLAFVFQTLAVRKPDLDAGVYAYAKAGFGEYLGFFSGWGYWASACIGNVTYWVLISSTLGLLWPGTFGHGDTLAAVLLGSAGLWIFHILITRGVQEAAVINKIVTAAKVVPILTFIVVVIFALKADVFSANLWGGGAHSASALFGQVRATMLTTVFVFLGIEGASVYSRYAKRRQDVGRATVIGLVGVTAMMVAVTVFSYGILSRAELQGLRQPSMAGVMEAVVGYWGTAFISVGVIISVVYLLWAYQQVFHGPPREADEKTRDLAWLERAVMAPLIILIVFLGVYPKPVLDRINPSVNQLIAHVESKTGSPTQPSVAVKGVEGTK